ncbi:PorV/PorQ family protein [bacterium]|nr:PorV/PorQ family protein [bacterium]MBU1752968.1 PorV/PorQ family protein [bacterium]
MKNMKNWWRLMALACVLLSVMAAHAEISPGKNGVAFLKVGVGARAIGMGEGFSAIADDTSAIYYNPAGLVHISTPCISTSYNQWIGGLMNGAITYVNPCFKQSAIGISAVYLGTNGIPRYDTKDSATSSGVYKAYDMSLNCTYAFHFTRGISFGINVKGISEKIDNEEMGGFAVDFGQLYHTPIDGLSLSSVVQNVGPAMMFKDAASKLPTCYKLGIAYRFPDYPLLIGCDWTKPSDNKLKINAGFECKMMNTLAIRGGFDSQLFEDLNGGLNLGFGFPLGPYEVDYAFVPTKRMGDTHRLSIGMRLGDQNKTKSRDLCGE